MLIPVHEYHPHPLFDPGVLTCLCVCVKQFAVEQCYSYEFYLEPGLGAPRCKLYGGLVAYEVSSIDPYQPYQWFDVACGDPTKFGT